MKLFVFIILCLSTFVAASQNDRHFSLEEAISTALESNTKSKNSRIDLEIAKKKIWETTAGGLPQITSSSAFQHYLKLPLTVIPADAFGGKKGEYIAVAFGQTSTASTNVTLNQTILDASYFISVQATKVYMEVFEQQKQKTEVEIRRLVVGSYCASLVAERNISIVKKNKESVDKTLYETQKMLENGLTEEQNYEQLKITAANIDIKLNYATRSLNISKKMLNLVMGIDVDTPIKLTDSLEALALKHTDKTLLQSVLIPQNNIDYNMAVTNVSGKNLILKTESFKRMPTLNGFISATYMGYSNTFSFFQNDQYWIGSSLVGLQLNIPIFTSFKTNAKVKQAQLEYDKSLNDLSQAKRKLQLDYETAKSDYQYSLDKFSFSTENLSLSENIEKKTQLKFLEGISTSFELRQAQEQLFTSQDLYLQSILDLINKKVFLETTLNSFKTN